MYTSCLEKQRKIRDLFAECADEEAKYRKIMELGKELPKLSSDVKVPSNLVHGCQSTMYLLAAYHDGVIEFHAESDALISSGLAALLIRVYSGESPEAVLKCTPDFIQELGIDASLTPSRANGLYSIHLRMKQDALRFLVDSTEPPKHPIV